MLKREYGKHPVASADARNADPLALEIGGTLDLGRNHEYPGEFVDETGNQDYIDAICYSAESGAGGRAVIELGLACGNGGYRHSSTPHVDALRLNIVFPDKA